MNELENDQTSPPEAESEPTLPPDLDEMSPAEGPGAAAPAGVPAPPTPKVYVVAEKFGTRKWWVYFGLGVVGFFVLNTLLWLLLSPQDDESIIICIGPLWLLMNLVILIGTLAQKLYAALLGYMGGYVLNFILASVLLSFNYSICGQPFYMPIN